MHFNLITILYMMKYLRVLCIKYTIDKTFTAISNMLSFMHYFVKSVLFLYRKYILCPSCSDTSLFTVKLKIVIDINSE